MNSHMKNSKNYIGVFDSGLGGLSVLKELHRLLPNEATIYLGDTARVPYGTKGAVTINRYALNCAKALVERTSLKMLLVACNTVSAVALDQLRDTLDCPVVGVVEPGAQAVVDGGFQSVGVIGTQSTISSGAYQHHLRALGYTGEIHTQACPLFVPLVEEGLVSGEIVDAIAKRYLAAIPQTLDALILGCTHYPLLLDALKKQFSHDMKYVDSGREAALIAQKLLTDRRELAERRVSENRYLVSDGCDKFAQMSQYYLGQNIERGLVELVDI